MCRGNRGNDREAFNFSGGIQECIEQGFGLDGYWPLPTSLRDSWKTLHLCDYTTAYPCGLNTLWIYGTLQQFLKYCDISDEHLSVCLSVTLSVCLVNVCVKYSTSIMLLSNILWWV